MQLFIWLKSYANTFSALKNKNNNRAGFSLIHGKRGFAFDVGSLRAGADIAFLGGLIMPKETVEKG